MLEGTSEFLSPLSTGVPDQDAERKAWIMSLYHLRFLADFGEQETVEKDGRLLTPFPDDFECWLRMGAPGIAKEDLEAYLSHHPI
jgi:hypothetical protein